MNTLYPTSSDATLDKPIRALVMSTNGLLSDGITGWMRITFSAMDRDGINLTTIAWDDGPKEIAQTFEEIGFYVETIPSRKRNPRGYATAYRDVLARGHFDIVHVSCNSALATFELYEAKKHGVKMRIAHSRNTLCTHRLADKILRPSFYRCTTDLYACGHDAGKWLFGNRPFTIIPNGKELMDWAYSEELRNDVRDELGIGPNEIALGHVGMFNVQKNHAKLMSVFAELRKRSDRYRLVLIGDGNLKGQVETLAIKLGVIDFVTFLGRRGDVPRLLNGLDCMMLPSLYEGFPNVVLEWQLAGLPCVMSDTITEDAAITSLVTRVPLRANDSVWADAVTCSTGRRHRVTDSDIAQQAAKAKGYDIHDNASLLRLLYLKGAMR